MRKRFFIIGWGIVMLAFGFIGQTKAMLTEPNVALDYYIHVYVNGIRRGYLSLHPTDNQQVQVDNARGKYTLWYFVKRTSTSNYAIYNKETGEQMTFNEPATDGHGPARIDPTGDLRTWFDLFTVDGVQDSLMTYYGGDKYYLTYYGTSVRIAKEAISTEPTSFKRITFVIQRAAFEPGDKYYRIRVDTIGTPQTTSIGYLSADTISATRDSIRIDTERNLLTLWKFLADTVVNDSTYYKIRNRLTGDTLAFVVPTTVNDTIAQINREGELNQWLTPFFTEENRTGRLMTRDTTTMKKYFLGMRPDKKVMLVSESSTIKKLHFYLEDSLPPLPPPKYQFDSTLVYRIKFLNGPNEGKYLGVDFAGATIYIADSVYAHIPDGQFIVDRKNTKGLVNRTLSNPPASETFYYTFSSTGDTIKGRYMLGDYLVEVKAIDYGGFDPRNSLLGYKYINQNHLSDSSHYFSYASLPDSLYGRLLGTDATVMIKGLRDTSTWLLTEAYVFDGQAAIGDIAMLKKYLYRMRSVADTTLYLSGTTPSRMTNQRSEAGLFLMKESTTPGLYQLLMYQPLIRKIIVSPVTKQLIYAPADTTASSLFQIGQVERYRFYEPDNYTYLTRFPDSKGKGFYEFRIIEPGTGRQKWLTKNFFDDAVLAVEGESMLRAGSYTRFDLQLWIDTARGTGFRADKPSFYIVKDVDTISSDINKYYISGYFLHVMDSSKQVSYKNSMINVDGKLYNRVNFVYAARSGANELYLRQFVRTITEPEINEYRFYFQESGELYRYYLVTESGFSYGDGGRTNVRGYLSFKSDTLYVGPDRDKALKVQFLGSTVSNVVVPPIPPASTETLIIGKSGQVDVLNAAGQPFSLYNMLGRLVDQRMITSDNESIPAPRGIHIVKAGPVTRKVVVQ